MTSTQRWPVAIIGSGNIGTDLMIKILESDGPLNGAHRANWAALRDTGIRMLDLTPASNGPFCVPVVNLDDHLDAPNLNMVTCGGQATVPIVAAVGKTGIVSYAEIVS
jgi:acetaldehyde dehydrogenase